MRIIIKIALAFFVWIIVTCFLYYFENQFICKLRFLKLYKVKGEITGLDSVSVYHSVCYISIITYQLYDMKYKTYVRSGNKDKVGDKIWIMSNGDISARVKPCKLKDTSYIALVCTIVIVFLLGQLFIEYCEMIDGGSILIAIGISVLWLIVYPLIFIGDYHDIKKQCGYLYKY